jgi:hypothetical protein
LNFLAYVTAIEATLLADHGVELHRAGSGESRVEWYVGALERLSRAAADYNLVAKTAYRIDVLSRFAEATDDQIVAEAERLETETTRLREFLGLATGRSPATAIT